MVLHNVIEHLRQIISVLTYNPSNIVKGVQFVNVIVDVFLAGCEQVIPCHFSDADPAKPGIKASQSRIARLRAGLNELLRKFH